MAGSDISCSVCMETFALITSHKAMVEINGFKSNGQTNQKKRIFVACQNKYMKHEGLFLDQ